MPGQEITRLRGSEGTITNTLYPPFGREFDLSVVSALLRCWDSLFHAVWVDERMLKQCYRLCPTALPQPWQQLLYRIWFRNCFRHVFRLEGFVSDWHGFRCRCCSNFAISREESADFDSDFGSDQDSSIVTSSTVRFTCHIAFLRANEESSVRPLKENDVVSPKAWSERWGRPSNETIKFSLSDFQGGAAWNQDLFPDLSQRQHAFRPWLGLHYMTTCCLACHRV